MFFHLSDKQISFFCIMLVHHYRNLELFIIYFCHIQLALKLCSVVTLIIFSSVLYHADVQCNYMYQTVMGC